MIAFTHEQAEAFLHRLVEAFNAGVRSGDFAGFVALFAEDAVLDIQGVPGDPYAGREAIAAHLREDAPDDQIRVSRWKIEKDRIVAEFFWRDISEAPGGCFTVTPRDEKIARLTVALGGPERCFR